MYYIYVCRIFRGGLLLHGKYVNGMIGIRASHDQMSNAIRIQQKVYATSSKCMSESRRDAFDLLPFRTFMMEVSTGVRKNSHRGSRRKRRGDNSCLQY